MLGYSQWLQARSAGPLTARQRYGLCCIERAAAHLLDLSGNVLDLWRIESDQLPLTLAPLALAPLVDEAISLLAVQAHAGGIRLSCGRIPEHLTVQADRVRMRQVLL